ncbi:hypothetical protein DL89DRAFT_266716 [Linderina pennispora]|uniref:Uncharacterized protein n=1 Tax=Linderina pennispora TaxID=61395 RepID=A0A1Y1WAF3_9FUNG|nr:uncharacterized protein DL89DRAFT_266716 [Linderina pennispora]ORX70503.1 hypothetical protein DL89DRAFT_266716 [Linderina pennispora]
MAHANVLYTTDYGVGRPPPTIIQVPPKKYRKYLFFSMFSLGISIVNLGVMGYLIHRFLQVKNDKRQITYALKEDEERNKPSYYAGCIALLAVFTSISLIMSITFLVKHRRVSR